MGRRGAGFRGDRPGRSRRRQQPGRVLLHAHGHRYRHRLDGEPVVRNKAQKWVFEEIHPQPGCSPSPSSASIPITAASSSTTSSTGTARAGIQNPARSQSQQETRPARDPASMRHRTPRHPAKADHSHERPIQEDPSDGALPPDLRALRRTRDRVPATKPAPQPRPLPSKKPGHEPKSTRSFFNEETKRPPGGIAMRQQGVRCDRL